MGEIPCGGPFFVVSGTRPLDASVPRRPDRARASSREHQQLPHSQHGPAGPRRLPAAGARLNAHRQRALRELPHTALARRDHSHSQQRECAYNRTHCARRAGRSTPVCLASGLNEAGRSADGREAMSRRTGMVVAYTGSCLHRLQDIPFSSSRSKAVRAVGLVAAGTRAVWVLMSDGW